MEPPTALSRERTSSLANLSASDDYEEGVSDGPRHYNSCRYNTGRGGRQHGQKNYSSIEIEKLLDIVAEVEPIGANM